MNEQRPPVLANEGLLWMESNRRFITGSPFSLYYWNPRPRHIAAILRSMNRVRNDFVGSVYYGRGRIFQTFLTFYSNVRTFYAKFDSSKKVLSERSITRICLLFELRSSEQLSTERSIMRIQRDFSDKILRFRRYIRLFFKLRYTEEGYLKR